MKSKDELKSLKRSVKQGLDLENLNKLEQSPQIAAMTAVTAEKQEAVFSKQWDNPVLITPDEPIEAILPPQKSLDIQPRTEAAMQSMAAPAAAAASSIIDNYLPSETAEQSDVVDRPFGYDFEDHETVELNSGALRYENVEFTLPGINGMDLVIKRIYDSTHATEKAFTFDVDREKAHFYYIYPLYDPSYIVEVGGPFVTSRDLNDFRAAAVDKWGGTSVVGHDYIHDSVYFNYKTALRDNTQYLQEHKLGLGWRLSLPSIETLPDGFNKRTGIGYRDYLHLGDGQIYKIVNGTTLEDHTLEDFTFAASTGSITFPDNSTEAYNYVVTFKDGKRYYLNRKNIVSMQDRFGNKLCFRFADAGITIWDSLNRITRLEKYNIANAGNYNLRWVLPDGRTMSYTVQNNVLAAVTDFEGQLTRYGYATGTQSARLFFDYSGDAAQSTTAYLLAAIKHPTGAETYYGWGVFRQQSTIDQGNRFRDRFVVASREDYEVVDLQWFEERNILTYGYGMTARALPKRGNDRHAEWEIEYFMNRGIVTDAARGKVTTTTFDSDFLRTGETVVAGSRTVSTKTFEYDSNRLMIKETAVINGNSQSRTAVTQWTYDSKGNLLQTVDPMNHVTDMEYHTASYSLPKSKQYYLDEARTRLIREEYALDSAGTNIGSRKVLENGTQKERTDYTYATNGNLTAQREYNTAGTLLKTITYAYQDNVFVSQATVDGLPQTLSQFDIMGNVVRETDPNGNITVYTRDNLGRLTLQRKPDGSVRQYFYFTDPGAWENTVYVVDEKQNQSYIEYTPLGKVQQVADVTNQVILEGHYYDEANRPLYDYTADEDLFTKAWTTYTLDFADRVLMKDIEDLEYSDTEYREVFAYDDAAGGQYSKSTKTVVGDSYAKNIVTVQYADVLGWVVREGTVIGGVERLTVTTYDAVGNPLTKLTALDASRGMPYSAKWEYDYAGRVVREYQPRESASAAEVYATSTYDALGNKVQAIDFKGNTTSFEYDALGRVTQQTSQFTDTADSAIRYEYDANGNLLWQYVQCNKPGEPAAWRRTEHRYDSCNREEDVFLYYGDTSDDFNRTHYVYDVCGNRTEVYTGVIYGSSEGARVQYQYDHFNNVTRITYHDQTNEYFFYDGVGRLKNKQDRKGNAIVYDYDVLDRPLEEMWVERDTWNYELQIKRYTLTGAVRHIQNQHMLVQSEYDEAGRLVKETESDGIVKTYGYDIGGNRTGMTVVNGSATLLNLTYTYDHCNRLKTVSRNGAVVATYTYDANGNRATLVNANGATTTYGYNRANLLTSLELRNGTSLLSQLSYAYYLDGNMAGKTEAGRTTQYVYDRLGQLVEESDSSGNAYVYEYDRFLNRSKLTVTGSQSYTVTYLYDISNRLRQTIKAEGGVNTVTTYTYDANGNRVAASSTGGVVSGETMAYNGFNQMVSVTKNGAVSTYAYRPDGLRFSKTAGGQTVIHIWDHGNIVAEIGGVNARYVRGIGLIAREQDGALQYYHHNAHGDVVLRTDQNGNSLQAYRYDAFGVEEAPVSTDSNPFRYCGEYFDSELDCIYLRARYYQPRNGQFTQEDSARDGVNWYTYCGNNPVLFVDPSGGVAYITTSGQQDQELYFYGAVSTLETRMSYLYGAHPIGFGVEQVVNLFDNSTVIDAWTFKEAGLDIPKHLSLQYGIDANAGTLGIAGATGDLFNALTQSSRYTPLTRIASYGEIALREYGLWKHAYVNALDQIIAYDFYENLISKTQEEILEKYITVFEMLDQYHRFEYLSLEMGRFGQYKTEDRSSKPVYNLSGEYKQLIQTALIGVERRYR